MQSLEPSRLAGQSPHCVIDPLLVFTKSGVPLVKQLSSYVNLWIGREVWHILNNINFYLHQPGLLNSDVCLQSQSLTQEYRQLQDTLAALQQWETLRLECDLPGLQFFWLGDSLRESFLPRTIETRLFREWEAIVHSLDLYLQQYSTHENILALAYRDTITLTVSLDSASILTYQQKNLVQNNSLPEICILLQSWNIPCHRVQAEDTLSIQNYKLLREMLYPSNITGFAWENLSFALLHIFTNHSKLDEKLMSKNPHLGFSKDDEDQPISSLFWSKVKCFWHFI
jgi:hypothetical protein